MGQKQENSKHIQSGKLGEFKAQIEEALATPVVQEQKAKRTVRLVLMNSGCGCGMFNFDIEREVDDDSPLKDGDHITPEQYLTTDRVL